ncbi:hypothetical protein [Streptomyces sp. NPDC048191]|uniref:hypothetical protein n=1 Tax=Streptomyces sp. NPDC048191 TaxID=3155484 RepID=UPI00340E175B
MKKRSMLAIATLATGFVVAAVTPSHAADDGSLADFPVLSVVDSLGQLVGQNPFADDDASRGHENGASQGHENGASRSHEDGASQDHD